MIIPTEIMAAVRDGDTQMVEHFLDVNHAAAVNAVDARLPRVRHEGHAEEAAAQHLPDGQPEAAALRLALPRDRREQRELGGALLLGARRERALGAAEPAASRAQAAGRRPLAMA